MKHYYVVLGLVDDRDTPIVDKPKGIIGVFPVFTNKKKAKKFAEDKKIIMCDVIKKPNTQPAHTKLNVGGLKSATSPSRKGA